MDLRMVGVLSGLLAYQRLDIYTVCYVTLISLGHDGIHSCLCKPDITSMRMQTH